MSKESDREERERARKEREAASQSQQALLATINKPDPLTELYRGMRTKQLSFFQRGAPNYDFSQTDKEGNPLFPGAPVFASAAVREARAHRESERTGLGALQLGSHGADPGLLAQMREQSVRQRSQDASLDAADAVNQARAETFGSVLPLSRDQNDRYGIASGATRDWRDAAERRYENRPQTAPWWQTVAQIGSNLGASYLTGGLASLGRGGGGGGRPQPQHR